MAEDDHHCPHLSSRLSDPRVWPLTRALVVRGTRLLTTRHSSLRPAADRQPNPTMQQWTQSQQESGSAAPPSREDFTAPARQVRARRPSRPPPLATRADPVG